MRARVQFAQKGLRHRGDHADLTPAILVPVTVGDLTPIVGIDRLERHLGVDCRDDLSGGTMSSSRQPLVLPTSMYSMKRTM